MPDLICYQITGTWKETKHRNTFLQLQNVQFKPEQSHTFYKPAHRVYISHLYNTGIFLIVGLLDFRADEIVAA
jgi:hypothetical protein